MAAAVSLVSGSALLVACPSESPAPLAESEQTPASGDTDPSTAPTAPTTATGTPGPAPDPADAAAPAPDAAALPPSLPTTSSGCGASAEAIARGKKYTTPSGRSYGVYVPAGYDRTKAWPVVVMFHGIQSSGTAFQSWFEQEKYVSGKAIVVYPDAQNGVWDVAGTKDLDFFDALVKQLGENACINPSRVFGFGFSMGAYFASYLGCKRAGKVKAISAGDGGWGGSTGCGRLPVLVTHRTADPDEVVANGRANRDRWTQLNGCTGGTTVTNATLNCVSQKGCVAPGAVTYCEDTWKDNSWPSSWNHTVREVYRQYTWDWFAALP